MDLRLANSHLGVDVTTAGGSVWRFFYKQDGREQSLFRDPPDGPERTAAAAGCFPLVPFGNRIRGNRFAFENNTHALKPNTPEDKHYLHGDGWTSEWHVLRQTPAHLGLGFTHGAPGSPYIYAAEQSFDLDGSTLTLTLTVTNQGPQAMPFGLGWHPFFPLTPATTLRAQARSYWDEDDAWLPTIERPVGGDLDFHAASRLPRRWVNAQFEGWDGKAVIRWPERRLMLEIDAAPLFGRYLVFVSDPAFDSGYDYSFFCFEPMSHSVDGHNRVKGGGLRRLAPGERLGGSVRFTCRAVGGAGGGP